MLNNSGSDYINYSDGVGNNVKEWRTKGCSDDHSDEPNDNDESIGCGNRIPRE